MIHPGVRFAHPDQWEEEMTELKLNVADYLRRIGLTGPIAPTAENLKLLTRAHLEAVPFENLQITQEHQIPSLEPEDLFSKIVENNRGGYCFELNKLFFLLLEALGYPCRSVAARIVYHFAEPRPLSHRAIVAVADGQKWYVDVGYGGAGPKGALSMDTPQWQNVYGDFFRITPEDHGYLLSRMDPEGEARVILFRDEPWLDVDFNTLNCYYATFQRSPFRAKRILYRCTKSGWINLIANVFTTCENGNVSSVQLEEAQIPDIIYSQFGLSVSCN